MRPLRAADFMLLATVTLWALNFTVTKYVINHGFQPVAYGCIRFGAAAGCSAGLPMRVSGRSRCAGATSASSRSPR